MTAIPTDQLDRCLIGAAAALTLAPENDSGAAHDFPTGTTVAATLKDGAGVAVAGTITATVNVTTNILSATIPATMLAALDTYTVTWTVTEGATTYVWETTLEVVGGHYFTVATLKALRTEFASLTAAQVLAARTMAEIRWEDECRVAFVPRGTRETVRCDGSRMLRLSNVALREVYSLSLTEDGVTDVWTSAEIAELEQSEAGILTRTDACWSSGALASVYYAHGYDRAVRPVREAVMTLAKDYIIPDSTLPPRAVLQMTDFGNFRLATADADHPFGMDDVDAVYRLYRRRSPVIG